MHKELRPARNPHPDNLTEAAMLETQVVTPSSKPTAVQEPPHLLTPLAALWPTATLPEPPKTPLKAPATGKASATTAAQPVRVTFVLFDPGATQVVKLLIARGANVLAKELLLEKTPSELTHNKQIAGFVAAASGRKTALQPAN